MSSREVEEDLDWENTTDAYSELPSNDTDYSNRTTPIYSIGPDFIVQWWVKRRLTPVSYNKNCVKKYLREQK